MTAPHADVIPNVTGQWGRWQLRAVLIIFLCKIPTAWFMACIIYTAPAPRHGEFYCKPPPNVTIKNETHWIKVSHPQMEEEDDHEFNIDFCNVYQDALEHAHQYFHDDNEKPWTLPTRNSNVIPCDQFQHKSDYHSLITQFDLVCSRDILVAVTQFFHLFGVLTGGILGTKLMEYYSPKKVFLFGMLAQITCGNLTGIVTIFEVHIFFRYLSAVCCALMYTPGQAIFCDITGGKFRTGVLCMFENFWSIGLILLPFLAQFFKSWSHIYMAISLPTCGYLLLWYWIPDSPTWLIRRGRVDEVKAILLDSARVNGCMERVPEDLEQQLRLKAKDTLTEAPPAPWIDIWHGPKAKTYMVAAHLAWACFVVNFNGMTLNIRAFSREDLDINTIVVGCSEIVGVMIAFVLIMTTTRKWVWGGIFNICTGIISLIGWLYPPSLTGHYQVIALMAIAMAAKASASTSQAMMLACTSELVPASKYKITMFSCVVFARFWLLTAPFINVFSIVNKVLPLTIFGVINIVGGFATCVFETPRTIPKVKATHLVSNMQQQEQDIFTIKLDEEKTRV